MKFDKKKLSIVLILICVISLIKTFYLLINDKKEEFIKDGCIKGKIVNVNIELLHMIILNIT